MNRDELYRHLYTLAEANKESNPFAASILFTLAGLVVMEEEHKLAVFSSIIANQMLNKSKNNQTTGNEN